MHRKSCDPPVALLLHPLPLGARQVRGAVPAGLARYPLLPMGVVGLCNGLAERGLVVEGHCLAQELGIDPAFVLEDWLATLPEPALVLIDLHWHEHALGAVELATAARAVWPRTWVLVGGLTASAFATELLALCPAVDGVVRGDAEGAIDGVTDALIRGARVSLRGGPNLVTRDEPRPPRWVADAAALDAMDAVDLGFLAQADAYRRLCHSQPRRPGGAVVGARGQWLPNGRGCAWACASCGGGRGAHERLGGREGPTWRVPEAVAADLERLRGLGVDQVALGLDPDMAGAAHRDASLGGSAGLGLYIESFQLPSAGMLRLLEGADLDHSEVALTAVSGDEALRRLHGKGFDDAALIGVFERLAARDLSASLFFGLGLPGASEASFARTMELARRLLERDRRGLLRLAALPQALDPLAPMGLDPDAWGLEPTDAGDFAARLARAERLARGELHPLDPEALGYRVPGVDLRAWAARWNALAAEAPPGAVIPVCSHRM